MEAKVKTALNGCAEYCKEFEIEIVRLYENNDIYYRAYRCANLEKCEALLETLKRAKENL